MRRGHLAVNGMVLGLVLAILTWWFLGVEPGARPVLFAITWPLWFFPLGRIVNGVLGQRFLRKVGEGMLEGGLPNRLDVDWGILVIRGARYSTPYGIVRLKMGRSNVGVWLPGRADPFILSALAGGRAVGKHLASIAPTPRPRAQPRH